MEEKKTNSNAYVRVAKHCLAWLRSVNYSFAITNPNLDKEIEKKLVIYCIHGTADRTGCFDDFKSNIISRLPSFVDSIKVIAFDNRFTGECIYGFAKQLKDQIVLNKDQDVVLIGHSRGGLVCTYFAEHLAARNDINVHLVTTVCSPFRGSYLALKPITSASNSVLQMSVGSNFLTELSEQVNQSEIPYLHIGATHDKVVSGDSYLPYNHPAQKNNTLLLNGEMHLSAMSTHELADSFLNSIKQIDLNQASQQQLNNNNDL